MSEATLEHKAVLDKEGWVLADESQPGIYIRSAEAEENNPLDWTSEPVELKEELGPDIDRIRAKYQFLSR